MINQTKFKNVNKILVIKFKHIGDVLLTIPVFRALRERFPNAHITALVNKGTEDVLSGNAFIDEIIMCDRRIKEKGLLEKCFNELSFAKNIRDQGFDMTVDLTSGDRAAIVSYISGARYRLAHDPGNRGFPGNKILYTHLSRKEDKKHMVLQNLDVVRRCNINTDNLSIDFHIPEDANLFIRDVLNKYNIENGETIVHIHPTSRWLFKCWKDEHIAEIIAWLIDCGLKVILTSSQDGKEVEKISGILSFIRSEIKDCSSKLINLSGMTDIKQLAAISSASDLFLGVDSAPMHIAAAVGTPIIVFFGPTGDYNWKPWYQDKKGKSPHTVIKRNWECIPCGQDGCNGTKISKCLEDITPGEVKDLISKKLTEINNQRKG